MQDVLSPTIEKEQIEAIAKISQEMNDQAHMNNEAIINGTAIRRVPAAISFTVSSNKEGGYCEGWITYLDGRKLYFYGKQTSQWGLPFVMSGGAPPIQVLPFETLVNTKGEYSAKGFWFAGLLSLSSNNRPAHQPPSIPIGGPGFGSWGAKGTILFTAG